MAAYRVLQLFLSAAALSACTPATVFDLEQRTSVIIPDLDGVTRVRVGDVSGRGTLASPFSPRTNEGGSAEDLEVFSGDESLAFQEDARIGATLRFEVSGVRYGLRVEGFDLHTFTDDSVTLLLFDDS